MAAILLDIDGVLWTSGQPIRGAADAVRHLRDAGHRLRFVTNNTVAARADLAGQLRGLGIELDDDEVQTTAVAAARELSGRRVYALVMDAVRHDLEGLELVDRDADAVLLGGADETAETDDVFAYSNLVRAFAELQAGARLVCLHKNRWWQTARGPLLDSGAFVAGLEYAAETDAHVVGKPSGPYFDTALEALGTTAGETWMVGDDIEADIAGAQQQGLRTVLVRTGKFREHHLDGSIRPDGVLDSVAALPEWLEQAA